MESNKIIRDIEIYNFIHADKELKSLFQNLVELIFKKTSQCKTIEESESSLLLTIIEKKLYPDRTKIHDFLIKYTNVIGTLP